MKNTISSESTETTEPSHRQDPTPHDDSTPMEEGEIWEVEAEKIGDKGVGTARIGPDFMMLVSEMSAGDRVQIRLTIVRENSPDLVEAS